MKFTKKDVINILWRFNQLGGEEVIDDALVRNLHVGNPNPKNTLLSFTFDNHNYHALFDVLGDNPAEIEAEIAKFSPNAKLELIPNPKTEFLSSIFRGKEVYLARELNLKKRLDVWVSEQYDAINRSQAQKLIKDGKVTVNGVKSARASLLVGPEDKIEAYISPVITPKAQKLPVIYEDGDVVVIDKPAGVLSHTKGDSCQEFTVADYLRPLNQDQEETNRTGIVHRLDRDTSGVMIGAKNEQARAKLQAQFSQRKAKKTYYAVIEGHLKNDQAVINLPIRRNAKRPTTFKVEAGGRESVTNYKVIEMNNKYSLIELKPETGRTHQLRVHLAHLGHPIVGDRVYGKEADRLYLHAAELEITLPSSERKVFKSAIPKQFKELVK